MSRKNRFYIRNQNKNEELEDVDIQIESNEIDTDEKIETSDLEKEFYEENADLLVNFDRVKEVVKENAEDIITKNSLEVKEKLEKLLETKKEFKVDLKDYVSSTLLTYYENTNSSKIISDDEVARWNYSLYKLFMYVLDMSMDEFKKNWQTILNFFNNYKDDCFNHFKLYRAPLNWPGTESEFKVYKTLAFICVETADPQNRSKAVKEMKNLENSLSMLSEDHRNKINSFYF